MARPPAASSAASEEVLTPSVLIVMMIRMMVSAMETKLLMNEAIARSVCLRMNRRSKARLTRLMIQAPIK